MIANFPQAAKKSRRSEAAWPSTIRFGISELSIRCLFFCFLEPKKNDPIQPSSEQLN